MSKSEIGSIAREFLQVWTVGNLHLLDTLAHPSIRVFYSHFSEPLEGVAEFRRVLERTFHHFPDMRTTPLSVIVDDSRAAVEWTHEGSHGAGDLFGVAPRGTSVRVTGITVYEIREGRVVEERGVVDNFGLMEQLSAPG